MGTLYRIINFKKSQYFDPATWGNGKWSGVEATIDKIAMLVARPADQTTGSVSRGGPGSWCGDRVEMHGDDLSSDDTDKAPYVVAERDFQDITLEAVQQFEKLKPELASGIFINESRRQAIGAGLPSKGGLARAMPAALFHLILREMKVSGVHRYDEGPSPLPGSWAGDEISFRRGTLPSQVTDLTSQAIALVAYDDRLNEIVDSARTRQAGGNPDELRILREIVLTLGCPKLETQLERYWPGTWRTL